MEQAFVNTGIVLSSIVFSLVMLQAFITCTYVMESCARAELLSDAAISLKPQEQLVIVPLSTSRKSPLSGGNVEENQNSKNPDPFHGLGHHGLQEIVAKQENHACGIVSNCSQESIAELAKDENQACSIRSKDVQEPVVTHENQACGILSNGQLSQASEQECRIIGNMDNVDVNDSLQQPVRMNKQRFSHVEQNLELSAIRDRKFELPELSRLFLGDTFRWIFTITAALDLYGLTWSIAAVFASSLATEFSIWNDGEKDYLFFMALFAAVAVPLTFVPLISQVWIQIIFFAGRVLMVFVMLSTIGAAYNAETSHFGTQVGPQRNTNLANWNTLQV